MGITFASLSACLPMGFHGRDARPDPIGARATKSVETGPRSQDEAKSGRESVGYMNSLIG